MQLNLYKLTDSAGKSGVMHGATPTQWGEGVAHKANGYGDLCGPGWLHAYEHPLLAVLLNPIHAVFDSPQLWEAIGEGEIKREGQFKCGVTRLTTIRQIPLPVVTTEMRVKFAILCAKQVCMDEKWNVWADKWLSGEDRSRGAAQAARAAAAEERVAAAWAAQAARAAAGAAVAMTAVRAARSAMWARAEAAGAAARYGTELDLAAIAEEACG
jgi:hypothetical protein